MASYFQLVYCSRRTESADPEAAATEIGDILTASRQSNADLGITGSLLSNDGCFAQALEGPVEAVEQLFGRIRDDPRHHDVVLLLTRIVPERTFPDWSMGLVKPSRLSEIESAAEVLEQAFLSYAQASDIKVAGNAIWELIRSESRKIQTF